MMDEQARQGYLDWRSALCLGEQIVHLNTPTEQRTLIESAVGDLLDCRAELWLHPEEFPARVFPDLDHQPQPASSITQRACQQNEFLQEEGPPPMIILGAPILFVQNLIGALTLTRSDGKPFSQVEIEFLDALARQCAFALHASSQVHIDQHRLTLLKLVSSVSAQVADVLDLDELANQVTDLILTTFKYYFVAIYTLEPNQEQLRFRGFAGPQFTATSASGLDAQHATEFDPEKVSVRLGEGIIGKVAATGVDELANDVSRNAFYRQTDALPETRSEFALPLSVRDQVLGVLDVQSFQVNAFDRMDWLVLHTLADHIATAVENARLYGDLRRHADQLSTLAGVSNAVTSLLDLDELLKEVVTLLRMKMGCSQVHVFTYQPVRQQMVYQAGDMLLAPGNDEQPVAFDLEDPVVLVSWAAKYGKTRAIAYVDAQEAFENWNFTFPDVRSEIAVPMIFGDQVLGVLDLQSEIPSAFGDEDRNLLEMFSDNIAIALRNAFLYRSEQWRRRVADSMREVAILLTADADLQQVLDLILTELQRTLPSDFAGIWLLAPLHDRDSDEGPELYLAALEFSESYLGDQGNSDLLEILSIFRQDLNSPVDKDWLGDVLRAEEPRIYEPGMPVDPLAQYLKFPIHHSAITAPLRIADQTFGLLHLGHHTPRRYGYESQMMTSTFASYAAVAIENTRLYEAAHDQAWVSTVLLEVAEATQSLATLEELLATMVRITPMLIGLSSCAIFLWEAEEEVFIPIVAHGYDESQMRVFNAWRTALGDENSFDQMYFSRRVVFIDQEYIQNSPVLQLLFYQAVNSDIGSLALVPMIAHGEIMGAMLVAFQSAEALSSAVGMPRNIDLEDKFAIVNGIAQQTAVAVENIQLLKAQKEEAYVSVALLQVAQAIVSLNALDEIMGAIVRLTPILIGVKRCAVFIFEGDQEGFRLSQTYGFSRSELTEMRPLYRTGEFSVLDSVAFSNGLVYFAFTSETESPATWSTLSDQDFNLVSLERSRDYKDMGGAAAFPLNDHLKEPYNLLFAYPLAVKGNVLGVMLTQEMESAGIPTLHVREKRQEISIGITQQAALAIQNDLLQRDVLERERMEQELQLARNIQQTFLPEYLPLLQSWDLDVRWKPAREVGGDFYDIVELPENHLGVVIADVADKGMPAALYMTLIRTLIRATAREMLSPAAVLRRVNDLLVNESKHGMFVTVAYAVIQLDTGNMVYANAGHNYPLLVNRSGQIHKLPTTGMAMGVVEGTPFGELQYHLVPGDLLVFYTDGVTEAFSTDSEMYGETRLLQVVAEHIHARSTDLLSAVEASIMDYIQGAPVSDDVTMVALRYSPDLAQEREDEPAGVFPASSS